MPSNRVPSIGEETLRSSTTSPASGEQLLNTLASRRTSQAGDESPSSVSIRPPPSSCAKVAIPSLQHRVHTPPAATDKKRTAKACSGCRLRKIKCSGRQPTCDHCDQHQLPCAYNDGKRERHKKGLERGDRMLQLLRDLSASVQLPANMRTRIKAIESEVPEDDRSIVSTASRKRLSTVASASSSKRPRSHTPGEEQSLSAEALVSAEVGSQQSADLVGEDLHQTEQTRATGFVGKTSEVAWAQRLAQMQNSQSVADCERVDFWGKAGESESAKKDRLEAMRRRHRSGNRTNDKVSDFNYHVDSEDVLLLSNVDKDELPPAEMAANLCDSYMENVQCMFPALSKPEFMAQFKMYLGSHNPESLPAKWRAILNLVFAIGARFSHLAEAPWRGDDRDHLIYYTRAQHLGFNGKTLLEHPDIQGIQVSALISFYYLAIGQVSRAWVMVGSACRHAVALGLHLRSEVPSIPPFHKEKRVRVWWSLYRLDNVLCEITGRPPAINHLFTSVPMPCSVKEDNVIPALDRINLDDQDTEQNSNNGKAKAQDVSTITCFRHHVLLAIIAQKVSVKLYSAATVTESWEAARNTIVALSIEMDQWYRNLPRQYQFRHGSASATHRERTLLGFAYYSTKILLNRPCLCRIDLRVKNIGEDSKVINDERSRECIAAARSMADLLPDDPDPDVQWLYCNGPWWCIVHHLMQAILVFMLELAFELYHMADPKADRDAILTVLKKLIKWLDKMSIMGNATARGACEQIREQLRGFASSKDGKIHHFAKMILDMEVPHFDSPLEARRPPSCQNESAAMAGYDGLHREYQNANSESSADYFGQHHRDQGGVSLDQISAHMTQRRQRQFRNLESWQRDQPQSSMSLTQPFDAAATLEFVQMQRDFGAGPGEPWEIHLDPTWNNFVWQTSHDQFNPFANAPGGALWPLPLQPQQMDMMPAQLPQQHVTVVGMDVGLDNDWSARGHVELAPGEEESSTFAGKEAQAPSHSWPPQYHHHHNHPQPVDYAQEQHQRRRHLPHPDPNFYTQDHQYNPYTTAHSALDDFPYEHLSMQHGHQDHALAESYEAAAALENAQGMVRGGEHHDGSSGREPYLN